MVVRDKATRLTSFHVFFFFLQSVGQGAEPTLDRGSRVVVRTVTSLMKSRSEHSHFNLHLHPANTSKLLDIMQGW